MTAFGKHCINFGLPGEPLLLPRVDSFVYLGVVASYELFEQQSFLHRRQIATSSRLRLIKILHSKQLPLSRRVCLYQACIRSSLLYGLHAVGINGAVLDQLDAVDARFLRGIARCPAHLTHESNVATRKRLRISSPSESLRQQLQRRLLRCTQPQAASAMQRTLELITPPKTEGDPTQDPLGLGVLIPCAHTERVACPTCGQYFGSVRIMLPSSMVQCHVRSGNPLQERCTWSANAEPAARS